MCTEYRFNVFFFIESQEMIQSKVSKINLFYVALYAGTGKSHVVSITRLILCNKCISIIGDKGKTGTYLGTHDRGTTLMTNPCNFFYLIIHA